jgi:DNA-binding XRE family transcriptional regulator
MPHTLKAVRKNLNVTQIEIADLLGITVHTIKKDGCTDL